MIGLLTTTGVLIGFETAGGRGTEGVTVAADDA